MSDEERAELEAMRAREAQWEAHLEEQEARMADAQSALWQQRQERDDMAAEWQAMKAQARRAHPDTSNPARMLLGTWHAPYPSPAEGPASSACCSIGPHCPAVPERYTHSRQMLMRAGSQTSRLTVSHACLE